MSAIRPGDIPAKQARDAAKRDAQTRRRSGVVQRVRGGTVDVLPAGGNAVLRNVPLSGSAKAGDTIWLEFADGAYRAHGSPASSAGGVIRVTTSGTSSTFDGTIDPSGISPQGAGSGLDADTVDGTHAAGLVATAFDVNTILTDEDGDVVSDGNGNVLVEE